MGIHNVQTPNSFQFNKVTSELVAMISRNGRKIFKLVQTYKAVDTNLTKIH